MSWIFFGSAVIVKIYILYFKVPYLILSSLHYILISNGYGSAWFNVVQLRLNQKDEVDTNQLIHHVNTSAAHLNNKLNIQK